MTVVADEKCRLRHEMRRRKAACTAAERARQSALMVERLQSEPLYRSARVVMLYWPLPDEVDIRTLIAEALRTKRVILPVVSGDDVVPVELLDMSDLHNGRFGIQEPNGLPFTGTIDLAIVPGVAFDVEGHRLGRGRGYYDRFLASLPQLPTVGVGFDFQIVQRVPCDVRDVPMCKVLFENSENTDKV